MSGEALITPALPMTARTVLAGVETARALLRVPADVITVWIETGRLRWVWDISVRGGSVRELRFWSRELIAPDTIAGLGAAQVIDLIVGAAQRARLHSAEVAQILLCSRPHVMRLVRSGELTGALNGHARWIDRASLILFFHHRLLGGI